MAFQAAGADPTAVKYVPYDAGGALNAAILSGEVQAGSTGFSEAVEMAKAGEARIIGVTSAERVPAFADAPTLKEQGYDAEFVNWRGFFAAPGLPADQRKMYIDALGKEGDIQLPRDRGHCGHDHLLRMAGIDAAEQLHVDLDQVRLQPRAQAEAGRSANRL